MQNIDYGVFGDALAAASIGTWRIEVDEGKEPRMYADSTMLKLLGVAEGAELSPEEVYHAWYDHVDPAHYDAVAEGVNHMLMGETAEIQYPWHHPDGRTIVVRCGGIRDEKYTAGQRAAGIHQWVTTMHHVNRELEKQKREYNEALNEAQVANQRTQAMHWILKSASWSILFDRDRKVTRGEFSPELFRVIRNDFSDFKEWIDLVHPDDRDEAVNKSMTALNDPTGSTTFDTEYRVRSRTGEYHWVRSAGRIILDRATGGGEMYGICIDIDESVKRRQEEQRQLEEAHALEKANKAKSYFFSTVSHDIRTPLNAIIGYAELLKLGIADEVERRKAIDSVLVSGHTLLELINDVLDLSKLEAGKMEILPEPVNARRLVEEVADAFRATLGGKPVEIRTVIGAMPWLKLDPQRVRQILFNFVGNAVKFTETGYVEISAGYEKGEGNRGTFSFSVSDTGCGISEDDQHRVMQPYVQVGLEASRGKGTGLGLAICKQLVARMGGELKLTSTLGKGSTFAVTLPDVEEDDSQRNRLSMTQRINVAVEDRSAKHDRLLVVDDVAMNRVVLKTMLAKFGITNVEMADNGFSALKKLKEIGPFDFVLTDMWMPGMDGERLVREIRKNPEWRTLPVYAVTADVEAQKAYLDMGFSGILLKPLTFEKLKEFFQSIH